MYLSNVQKSSQFDQSCASHQLYVTTADSMSSVCQNCSRILHIKTTLQGQCEFCMSQHKPAADCMNSVSQNRQAAGCMNYVYRDCTCVIIETITYVSIKTGKFKNLKMLLKENVILNVYQLLSVWWLHQLPLKVWLPCLALKAGLSRPSIKAGLPHLSLKAINNLASLTL